jgi:hypothetical protein
LDVLESLEDALRANPHSVNCRYLDQLRPLQGCRISLNGYAKTVELAASSGRRIGDYKPQALSTRQDLREQFLGMHAFTSAAPVATVGHAAHNVTR